MKDSRTICDSCRKDITGNGSTPGFTILLTTMPMKTDMLAAYAVLVSVPVLDKDFCSLACLKAWVNKEVTE